MADNNSYDTTFTKVLTCSSSDQSEDMLILRTWVTLVASADCFVNFDKEVTASSRHRLVADVPMDFKVSFSKLHYMADSGTPLIHVTASRS